MFGNMKKVLLGVALVSGIISENCLASMIEYDSSSQSSRRSSGQQDTVVLQPYEKAAYEIFERYNGSIDNAEVNENFLNLLSNIAGGTYNGCETFTDAINFRKTLTSLLLESIFKSENSATKTKACFYCLALRASSQKAEDFMRAYNLTKNLSLEEKEMFLKVHKEIREKKKNLIRLNDMAVEFENLIGIGETSQE